MRTLQQPTNRPKTNRQIKGVGHTGTLTIHDANRSIAARKAKENAAEKKRLAKGYNKK